MSHYQRCLWQLLYGKPMQPPPLEDPEADPLRGPQPITPISEEQAWSAYVDGFTRACGVGLDSQNLSHPYAEL